jgi:outer membrane protein, heavy metal efflux system
MSRHPTHCAVSPTPSSARSTLRTALPLAALALVVALLPSLALATPLGLPEAMNVAEREAPALRARHALQRAAGEEAARAGELPDPVLTLGIDNLPVTGSDAGRFGADDMTMRRIGLMQEWPLPSKRRARRAEADAGIAEAGAEVVAGRLQVRRAAAEAWISRWEAETALDLLDALQVEVLRATELIETRLRSGVGAAGDALQARGELAVLESRRIEMQATRAAASAELARWLGDTAARPLADAPDFAQLPLPPEQLRAALDRHAALQPAQARVLRAERGVDLARADRRPDLSFAAAYGARSGAASDMLMLEVGVGLPLFTRNRQDRTVAARLAEHDAAAAELDDLRRQQAAELERELALWEGRRAQVTHTRERLLPLARDRGRLAIAALGSGSPLQPWLTAHHDEVELRMQYAGQLADLGRRWAWLATLLNPLETPTHSSRPATDSTLPEVTP